ncbi:MAG: DUF2784 family protein [Fimbriimonadaceae bacterium]
MNWLLLLGDGAFWLFHTALIFFNLLGWIPKRTRRFNLIALAVTLFSWLIMGIWYGVGYCICTDWHFQIRDQLGLHDNADSYLQLLVRKLGIDPPLGLLNNVAGICMVIAVSASIKLNIRDFRAKSRMELEPQ